MSAHASPNIITDGLAFMYDTGSGKSYRGEPTINYIHSQNAVAQDSYSTWSATAAGTYNAKHPNAIAAYNAAGTQISGYYNSGVGDATNTYHAHWQYDPILKKPVVVMNDLVSGQWKAKWMGTGLGSWNSQSKSHGDTYTISWLQWVDHLSKNAKAGLYTKNTSGGNGFHDGQANSASSYNTKLHTWQRVYQTYTTNSVRDLSQTLASIYMYGHYNVRATVKVADVQFTWGSHPVQFSAEYERSATQGLLDRTNNSTINLSNVSFDSDAQITLDGTDDYIDLGSDVSISPDNQGWTTEYWFNTNSASTLQHFNSAENDEFNANWLAILSSKLAVWNRNPGYWKYGSTQFSSNTWYQAVFICDAGGTNMRFYVNGEAEGGNHVGNVWTASYSSLDVRYIGKYEYNGGHSRYFNGEINAVKIYDRALTSAEVLQNFNATKDRFGL